MTGPSVAQPAPGPPNAAGPRQAPGPTKPGVPEQLPLHNVELAI